MHVVRWLTPPVLCLLLAGCDSQNSLARVTGTVTLNGHPLEGAIVQFQPVADGGSPSAAKTDSKGQYELMYTFTKPGVIPGEHIVTIRSASAYYSEVCDQAETQECVPPEYNSQTQLKRIVEPGRNTIDFEL